MNIELLDAINEVKKAILSSEEYQDLLKKEDSLNSNDNAKILSYKKDMIIVKLEDLEKIEGKNSLKVLSFQKELANILTQLNSLKDVKEYNEAYKKYNEILDFINEQLFGEFNK